MFNKKETTTYQPDVTAQMQQFAIMIPRKNSLEKDVERLNQWCYENHCVPLNFDITSLGVYAVVKRI